MRNNEEDPYNTALTWGKADMNTLTTVWSGNQRDDFNDTLTTMETTPNDDPVWLMMLDQGATLFMICNTIILMLGMGAATCWKKVLKHLRQPWACLLGMGCQFMLLPAVAFGLCFAFHLPPYESLGVLILACSPSGAFSNFFTYWVEGDLALSIIMTVVSSLLAFGMMPLNLWLYSWKWTQQELQVPYFNILITLLIVTVPVVIGMVIQHFNMKWASYISKVCCGLGWAGAIICAVLIIIRYWDIIVRSSIYLVIIAALTPMSGFVVSYILVKLLCLSQKICRTVAIETACQNMMVATSIILLSFSNPRVRGQMVLFPVLYGLCQLAEILVVIGVFQTWSFIHRYDVTEEIISVVDSSVLTSIPVPAHKLSQAYTEMANYSTVPNSSSSPGPPSPPPQQMATFRNMNYSDGRRLHMSEEIQSFLSNKQSIQASDIQWNDLTPSTPSTTPYWLAPHDLDSTTDYPQDSTDMDLCSDTVLESALSYDSDIPYSPTLSNKGVPNMFPVTENDFTSEGEGAHPPNGSPIGQFSEGKLENQEPSACTPSLTSQTSPNTHDSYNRPFAFYHDDVCVGQTLQFSTFNKK